MPALKLRDPITCPHCWHEFPPEEVRWVSQHPDLGEDLKLGQDHQIRFVPTRFDVSGNAIDERGAVCTDLACQQSHLNIAWSLLQMKPLFVSVVGSPGSGKTYLLAAMVWQLRRTLLQKFALTFGESDLSATSVLSENEKRLFHSENPHELVTLAKTELDGEMYQSVNYGAGPVWYPQPFVFPLSPVDDHPDHRRKVAVSRALCLYDNAGEHFLPGQERYDHPAAHLALSEVILFLFDPTQNAQFRQTLTSADIDPQFGQHRWTHLQDRVLIETARRIRMHNRWPEGQQYLKPLIVVVNKFDAWSSLFGQDRLDLDIIVRPAGGKIHALNLQVIKHVSHRVREFLLEYSPELVNAAEGFAKDVTYVPVSATGCSPEQVGDDFLFRPCDLNPMWVEVPVLIALQKTTTLVRGAIRRSSDDDPEKDE